MSKTRDPNILSIERRAAEEHCAQWYAGRILDDEPKDWPLINREIEQRWSLTALRRIKTRAWAIVSERRP